MFSDDKLTAVQTRITDLIDVHIKLKSCADYFGPL